MVMIGVCRENGWKRVGQVESTVGQEGVGRW